MALPTTDKISHSMIMAEFKKSGTFSLSSDGAPLIEKTPNALIKESDFYGASDVLTGECSATFNYNISEWVRLGMVNGSCAYFASDLELWTAWIYNDQRATFNGYFDTQTNPDWSPDAGNRMYFDGIHIGKEQWGRGGSAFLFSYRRADGVNSTANPPPGMMGAPLKVYQNGSLVKETTMSSVKGRFSSGTQYLLSCQCDAQQFRGTSVTFGIG